MSGSTLAVVLIGGAIGYELTTQHGGMADPAVIRTGITPGGVSVAPATKKTTAATLLRQNLHPSLTLMTQPTAGEANNAVDQKIRELNDKVKEEYNKLSCDAKKDGAERLKKKYPTIQLDPDKACDMSYEDLAKIAGGAVAAAACNAIPGVGTLASPMCAIAGAYVADKIEQWIENNWDDASNWIQNEASDAENYVEQKAKDAVNTVIGWF
jgi:hypothetical protein